MVQPVHRAAHRVRQPHRRRSRALRRPQPGRHRAASLLRGTRRTCRRAASCSSARPPSRARPPSAWGGCRCCRSMIGRMVTDELVQPDRRARMALRTRARLASPARGRMGLGRFFARFDEDCDGTIGVSETKLPGHTRPRDAAREPHGHAAVARRRAARWASSSPTAASPPRSPPSARAAAGGYWNLKRSSRVELSLSLIVSLRHPVQLPSVAQL